MNAGFNHRLAQITALAVWVLIGAGSLVTTTGSGLSIPDWPLAFRRLIPPRWEGGVAFEYSHRVIAAIVFLLITVLAIRLWRTESRRWVRGLAVGVWWMVLVQAILGGITVLYELPTPVSVSHAGLAHATFATVVGLAVLTGPGWKGIQPVGPSSRRLAPWATALVAITYLQILIGAWMRHTAAGLAVPDFPLAYGHLWPPSEVVPPYLKAKVHIHMTHRVGALVMGVLAHIVAIAALRRYRTVRPVVRSARTLLFAWFVQILLGGWIIWKTRPTVPTSLHVMLGAGLLGLAVWLALSLHRVERHA